MAPSGCWDVSWDQIAVAEPNSYCDPAHRERGVLGMASAGDLGRRRILCLFPRYDSAFGMFEHAYPLMDGVRALMPPQGLLLIAAALPACS